MLFACETAKSRKDKSKVPKLSEIEKSLRFLGARFQIAAFQRFRKSQRFRDAKKATLVNTFTSATDAPLFLGVDACQDPGEGQF